MMISNQRRTEGTPSDYKAIITFSGMVREIGLIRFPFGFCSSQPSIIYWLSSPIFPCLLFVCCPALVTSPPTICFVVHTLHFNLVSKLLTWRKDNCNTTNEGNNWLVIWFSVWFLIVCIEAIWKWTKFKNHLQSWSMASPLILIFFWACPYSLCAITTLLCVSHLPSMLVQRAPTVCTW